MQVAEHHRPGGYVHRDTQINQIVEAHVGELPLPAALRRRELAEMESRNIGNAALDDIVVDVQACPDDGTVTLRMDERTAAVMLYASRLMACDLEAHIRDAHTMAEQMPVGSYGYVNRLNIATRKERIAQRLRAVERSYQDVIEKDWFGI